MESLDGDHWPEACHPEEEEASNPVNENCSSAMTTAHRTHSEASGAQPPAVTTQRPEVQDWSIGSGEDVG